MLSRSERLAKLERECDEELRLTKGQFSLDRVRHDPEARSRSFAKMLGNHILDNPGIHPGFLKAGYNDPQPYTILPPEVRKATSMCGAAPIRKGDGIEGRQFDNADLDAPTPNTLRPGQQQHDLFIDPSPFSSLGRSDVENAHGSVWAAANARGWEDYTASARAVLPGIEFPSPNHAAHRDNRSIGWDDGSGKVAKRAVRNIPVEIADIDRQILKAERAGKHEHAADLRVYRRNLVRDFLEAA